MDAYQTIRRNKIKLRSILRKDINYVYNLLSDVQLITHREKRNLIATTRNRYRDSTWELMNRIMDKGEESCIVFLSILKDPALIEKFPDLLSMAWYNHTEVMNGR